MYRGLVCPGAQPFCGKDDPRFLLAGDKNCPTIRLWPGFCSVRQVRAGGKDFPVTCSVREGSDGPLFSCNVLLRGDDATSNLDGEGPNAISSIGNSTTAVTRTILGQLAQHITEVEEKDCRVPSQVKGPHFFGLRTATIVSSLREDGDQETEWTCTCIDDASGTSDVDNIMDVFVKDRKDKLLELANVRWGGIQERGRMTTCSGWTYTCGGETLQLRAGFTALREVRTVDGKWVPIICEIIEQEGEASGSTSPPPCFKCSATAEGKCFSITSPLLASSARQILHHLKAKTTHHWGADFFGLRTSTVRQLFSLRADCNEPPAKSARVSRPVQLSPILVRLQKAHQRGSLPTSELKKKESRDSRNELVNDVASYASFGDVKSKSDLIQLFVCEH